jgi:hypothetical protein
VSRRRGGTHRIAGSHLATLAGRLTPRDRVLLRLLAEHQVLTVAHCADLLYGSQETARHRLVSLHRLKAVDRFRPLVGLGDGSAPYHYVLGEAGASVLAAELGVQPHQLGYRRDQALAIAHQPGLAQLLAINGFFASLAAAGRAQPSAALIAWWSAARCANQWGKLVRPDGYGRWRCGAREVDFFLEHPPPATPGGAPADQQRSLGQLADKLAGYLALAAQTKIATPILLWLDSPDLEANARATLPRLPVPAATASRALGDPTGPIWLPLAAGGPRRLLLDLHQPPPSRPA